MPATILFADPDHGPRAQLAAALLRSIDEAGSFEGFVGGHLTRRDLTAVAEVLAERGLSFIPSPQQLELSMARTSLSWCARRDAPRARTCRARLGSAAGPSMIRASFRPTGGLMRYEPLPPHSRASVPSSSPREDDGSVCCWLLTLLGDVCRNNSSVGVDTLSL